jgi:hypothetical protein
MSLTQTAWRWHRWLGWVIGLQVLVWLTSGLVFAWLPFEPWVKGGDALRRPALELRALPPGAPAGLVPQGVTALAAVATPHGAAWKARVRGEEQAVYWRVDGQPWQAPDAAQVSRFARTLVDPALTLAGVGRLASVPRRLGLVEETGGRGDLWLVRFDDRLGTRLYLDGQGGELVAIRNEAWVWYDFLWRLHIMDYRGGEDFNNVWLRAASAPAWALAACGVLLAVLALQRRWRRRR